MVRSLLTLYQIEECGMMLKSQHYVFKKLGDEAYLDTREQGRRLNAQTV